MLVVAGICLLEKLPNTFPMTAREPKRLDGHTLNRQIRHRLRHLD
jgi:hypothetical protein